MENKELNIVDVIIPNTSLAYILGGLPVDTNPQIESIMDSIINTPENNTETTTVPGILKQDTLERYGFETIILYRGLVGLTNEIIQKHLPTDDRTSVLCYTYDVAEDMFNLVMINIVNPDVVFGVLKDNMKEMLTMQHSLNVRTNGPDYLYTDINVKNGKHIDFALDTKMELAELINTIPYKHWDDKIFTLSDTTINHSNILVEHTDIWHFLMSHMLQASAASFNDIKVSDEDLINNLVSGNISTLYPDTHYSVLFNFMTQLAATKDEDLCGLLYSVTNTWIKTQSHVITDFQNFLMVQLLLDRMYGFDFAELVDTYLGKNTLNKFRLDNGYKEGKYKKIWLLLDKPETDDYIGKEDNEFMIEMVKELNSRNVLTSDNLYKMLEEKYKEVLEEMKPMETKEDK